MRQSAFKALLPRPSTFLTAAIILPTYSRFEYSVIQPRLLRSETGMRG
jgi:hypothetical protein